MARVQTFQTCVEIAASIAMMAAASALLITVARGSTRGESHRAEPAPPLPTDAVTLDGAQVEGSRNARVAMIEFSDFQCPYCGGFARDTLGSLEQTYVRSGKVLLAFKHLPLERLHPFALKAAEGAECAALQGKFWEMHALLFADQSHLEEVAIRQRAAKLGLDRAAFDDCLNGQVTDKVRQAAADAARLAVSGTPTFFLGSVRQDGKVDVTVRYDGAITSNQVASALDRLLGVGAAAK
jgi:protein-disulfide isomerase